MEEMKIHIKFIQHMAFWLALQGVLSALVGVLIFMYPDLLGILVGLLLIVLGVVAIALAVKVNKYSNIKINV